MTIQVMCQCGFRKDVPDDWLGMRVKCKCGRSFVISMTGSVEEPPLVAPPVQPQTATSETTDQQHQHADSVAARYRARHQSADARKRWVLGVGVVVTLVCLGALAFVLRDHLFPTSAQTAQAPVSPDAKPSPETEQQLPASTRHKSVPSGTDNTSRFNTQGSSAGQTGPIELEPDDGVLLTDLFGDVSAQLQLTEEQSAQRTQLTAQFTSKADELRGGQLDLAQWFIDCGTLGGELLAILTEAQQDKLRELMENGKIQRTRLEAYAAQLRPELATPSVVWRLDADEVPLEPIADATIAVPTTGQPLYTTTANGFIALQRADQSQPLFDVWNLLENRSVGSCLVPDPAPDDMTRLAAGGQYVVRGGRDSAGNYRVQVWPVAAAPSGAPAPRTQTLPVDVDADTCRLIGCSGGRVLCVAANGFWVWNLENDESRGYGFSQWAPVGRPTCALSPGGRYVAMAHCHSPTIDGKQYNFLELGIYDSDSGELLGNRVTATDYRPFGITRGDIQLQRTANRLAVGRRSSRSSAAAGAGQCHQRQRAADRRRSARAGNEFR